VLKPVIVPTLGLDIEEVTITHWLCQAGGSVRQGEPLFVVETEKASMEIEATASGVLQRILYPEGSLVRVTDTVAFIETEEKAAVETPVAAAAAVTATEKLRASPAARRLSRELGVDLSQVKGAGPQGRVQGNDVRLFARSATETIKASPVARRIAEEQDIRLSQVAPTGPGGRIMRKDVLAVADLSRVEEKPPGRVVPPNRKRRITAERMALSARTVARVTLHTEVDASELVRLRTRLLPTYEARYNVRLSYNAILLKVVAAALVLHPHLNARWTDQGLELVESINIGAAVAVADGLVVPVVREADRKSLAHIAVELQKLVEKANQDKLTPDEMSGGAFTITNLGAFGIDSFTPIVNPPEIAILGVGRMVEKPVGRKGEIALCPMMTLSLSFDHRAVDGAPAARFLQAIGQLLSEPYLLI
jgi:pyruvate dehydrogenase E2 component (dihydrolipoamide acetyltransferase)